MRVIVVVAIVACARDAGASAKGPACKATPVTTIVPLPSKAVAIAVAHEQACAVLATGRVWCWGNNNDQQLALTTRAPAVAPQDVGLEKVVELSLDDLAGCARHTNGNVTCWGHKYGWNQTLPQSKAARPPATLVVDRVTAGQDHTCVIVKGEVNCYGELGSWGGFPATHAHVPGIANATDIAAGGLHDCAVAKGRVLCWGLPVEWSCDAQCEKDRRRPTAHVLPDVDDAIAVGVSVGDVCALRKIGEVQCWRANVGHAGILTATVAGLRDAKQIALGDYHGCAVRKTGEVACWGEGRRGALGDGHTQDSRDVARAVLGINNAVSVGAGIGFSCALLDDGRVACWGVNDHRQLAIDTLTASTKSVEVCGLDRVTQLAARDSGTCALRANGDVMCWGASDSEQGRLDHSGVPVLVPGIKAVELAASGVVTCARTKNGSVSCWGRGSPLKLPGEPVRQLPNVPVRQIAFGRFGLCAIAKDRSVICDGARVKYVDTADKVVVGDNFACALTDQRVACWGPGSRIDMPEQCSCPHDERMACTCEAPVEDKQPRIVDNEALDIAAHGSEICVRSKGDTTCGEPTRSRGGKALVWNPWSSTTNGLEQVTQLTSGREHSCALRSNGLVSCWGDNTYGQLGSGALGLVHTPKLK